MQPLELIGKRRHLILAHPLECRLKHLITCKRNHLEGGLLTIIKTMEQRNPLLIIAGRVLIEAALVR